MTVKRYSLRKSRTTQQGQLQVTQRRKPRRRNAKKQLRVLGCERKCKGHQLFIVESSSSCSGKSKGESRRKIVVSFIFYPNALLSPFPYHLVKVGKGQREGPQEVVTLQDEISGRDGRGQDHRGCDGWLQVREGNRRRHYRSRQSEESAR
ncbi:unnamed protein product [Amoebophrya sp. A25]|nr:unnamed protein product [Amoebophrya sp. A25]|eukprot:GSA25T00006082001.1